MDKREVQTAIRNGNTCLGIEFGSTRIKGVVIDYDGTVLATGAYEWENSGIISDCASPLRMIPV